MLEDLYSNFDLLRDCQRAAAIAAVSHFMTSSEPALISLPTGSGKTTLIALLHVIFKSSHTLVVTPTELLRKQTRDKLENFSELRSYVNWPAVRRDCVCKEVKKSLSSDAEWHKLDAHEISVLTPKVVSPFYKKYVKIRPSNKTIDLVIVDEAHHGAAPSWRDLINGFSGTKIILLTATPFRLDKRRLPGVPIYKYSISRAVNDKIYRKISYKDVSSEYGYRDVRIARAVKETFPTDGKIVARVNRINRVPKLIRHYKDFDCVAIHSDLSDHEQEAALTAFRKSKRCVLVVVDIASEGLDLPDLDAIAIHDAPRSLPTTLQLLGRLSRTNVKSTNGLVISSKELIQGPVRKLYYSERQDWQELLAELFDEFFATQNDGQSQSHGDDILDIVRDCVPTAVAKVFRVKSGKKIIWSNECNFLGHKSEKESWEVEDSVRDGNMVCVITIRKQGPSWLKKGKTLQDITHDFHFFYRPHDSDVLFRVSTCQKIAIELAEHLIDPKNLERLCYGELANTCSNVNQLVAAGLRHVATRSGTIPDYKSHFGQRITNTFNYADRFQFHHDFGCGVAGGGIVGFSVNKSKIWHLAPKTIAELKHWCDGMSRAIEGPAKDNPAISNLSVVKPFDLKQFIYPLSPAIVIPPTDGIDFKLLVSGKYEGTLERIRFVITALDKKSLEVDVFAKMHGKISSLSYHLTSRTWTCTGKPIFVKDLGKNEQISLESYYDDHPPTIILEDGSSIVGANGWRAGDSDYTRPLSAMDVRNWNQVDIQSEKGGKGLKVNPLSIFDQVQHWLKADLSKAAIINDDGAGEFADFVCITDAGELELYHCKASSKPTAGKRLPDIYEVCGQAEKSLDRLVIPAHALKELNKRLIKGTAKIVRGETILQATLQDQKVFVKARVIVVIPAVSRGDFTHNKARTKPKDLSTTDKKFLCKMLTTLSWIESFGYECRFWTSP